jgi:hypothetical protein
MQIKVKRSHRKIGKSSRKVTKMKRLRRAHRKLLKRTRRK